MDVARPPAIQGQEEFEGPLQVKQINHTNLALPCQQFFFKDNYQSHLSLISYPKANEILHIHQ